MKVMNINRKKPVGRQPQKDPPLKTPNSTSIFDAAIEGNLLALEFYIDQGMAQSVDRYGHTPLILAARYGHLACVNRLIPVSHVNAMHGEGGTALMDALISRHEDCFEALLKHSDVNQKNQYGANALMVAIRNVKGSCFKYVDRLLPLSCLRDVDTEGSSFLTYAVRNLELFRHLLARFDWGSLDDEAGINTLKHAICMNEVEVVTLLLPRVKLWNDSNALLLNVDELPRTLKGDDAKTLFENYVASSQEKKGLNEVVSLHSGAPLRTTGKL